MTRRTLGLLMTLALSFSWSWLTAAAPPGQMPRVGVLASGSPPAAPDWKARSPFMQELRTLGWVEGQNLVLEYRWAEGQPHRLSPLAAELVRLPVDVIVTGDTSAIRAMTHATTTVPLVMVSVEDPLEWGAIATLARPGAMSPGWVAWCSSPAANCWNSSKKRCQGSRGWRSSPVGAPAQSKRWSTPPRG